MTRPGDDAPLVAVIAGEASGDRLGASLMAQLVSLEPGIRFMGVGGEEMEAHGLQSVFPMAEIAVMGPIAILIRLRSLLRRIQQAADAIAAAQPDILIIIDCPEFSHRVAKAVKRMRPVLPVIDYVAPSVWAWRPGRARAMRRYIDLVLALLPFEPEVFERLGGPPCRYVGHPAVEAEAPSAAVADRLRAGLGDADEPVLVVMPGSRHNELRRLCAPIGEAVGYLSSTGAKFSLVLPTLQHLRAELEERTSSWSVRPTIVTSREDRHAAMELGDAAIVRFGYCNARTGARAQANGGLLSRRTFNRLDSLVTSRALDRARQSGSRRHSDT